MSEIKRFNCGNNGYPFCQGCYTMNEDSDGDYVKHEDFETLRQRVAELEAWNKLEKQRCDEKDEAIIKFESEINKMREALGNPQQWVVTNKRAFEHTCNSLIEAKDLCNRTPVLPTPSIVVLCAIPMPLYESVTATPAATQPKVNDE